MDDVIFLGSDEKTDFYPYLVFARQGFRIAVAPEPSGGLMLLAGVLAVALCARYKHPEH